MRALLILIAIASLLIATLPGVSAETYRYASVPAPGPECHDDLLGQTDGICFGSVTFTIAGLSLLTLQDDLFGEAGHYVCYHDGSGCDTDSPRDHFDCAGWRPLQDAVGATHATVFFPYFVAVMEDLSVCGATTGTLTVA